MGASLDGLVDELRDAARELDAAVWQSGLQGRFTSTYRSHSEQQRLYRAYISGRHAFPVAAPGSSAHEYGEAFDYLVTPSSYQRDVGLTWVDWGGEWGGSADVVHFELPGATARALARAPIVEPFYVRAANVAAGFLPGPAGLAASFSDVFTSRSQCGSKWESPTCFGEWVAGRCCR
jgi:hypothetical protein